MRKKCLLLAMLTLGTSGALYADEAPELSNEQLFQHFCSSCHGSTARGNGPVAPALKRRVPDLTRIAARNGGHFDSERVRRAIDGQTPVAAHGSRAMPVWGWEWYAYKGEDEARRRHVAERVERLVTFLASIQRK